MEERHVDVYCVDEHARRLEFGWTLPWDVFLGLDREERLGLHVTDPHGRGECDAHIPVVGNDWTIRGPVATVA